MHGSLSLKLAAIDGQTRPAHIVAVPPLQCSRVRYDEVRCPGMACLTLIHLGGVLQGDRLDLDVTLEPGAAARLTTAAATQIYRMPANGGEPQRVTFEGSYNVSPRLSPDGKMLAYITRNEGKFQVALLDLGNRQTQIITDSDRDESPSLSPNGRMILLATVTAGRGVLSAVSADGRFKQRLSAAAGGDVREPAWGPFIE